MARVLQEILVEVVRSFPCLMVALVHFGVVLVFAQHHHSKSFSPLAKTPFPCYPEPSLPNSYELPAVQEKEQGWESDSQEQRPWLLAIPFAKHW